MPIGYLSEDVGLAVECCISQTSCHCDQIPERNNLSGERILAHGFTGYSSWSVSFIVSGSVVRQNIMAHGGADLLSSWQLRRRQRTSNAGERIMRGRGG
jgi:hypothetical protein